MFIIASVRCSVIDTIIPSERMFVTAVLSQMLLWDRVLVVSHRQVFLTARCRVTAVLGVKESYKGRNEIKNDRTRSNAFVQSAI